MTREILEGLFAIGFVGLILLHASQVSTVVTTLGSNYSYTVGGLVRAG